MFFPPKNLHLDEISMAILDKQMVPSGKVTHHYGTITISISISILSISVYIYIYIHCKYIYIYKWSINHLPCVSTCFVSVSVTMAPWSSMPCGSCSTWPGRMAGESHGHPMKNEWTIPWRIYIYIYIYIFVYIYIYIHMYICSIQMIFQMRFAFWASFPVP